MQEARGRGIGHPLLPLERAGFWQDPGLPTKGPQAAARALVLLYTVPKSSRDLGRLATRPVLVTPTITPTPQALSPGIPNRPDKA